MIKRVFLYSFLFYLLILVLPELYVGWRHLEIDRLPITLIIALVLTAIGFYIGVFISAVLQKPDRELQFYVTGQLLPATFIIIVYLISWLSSHKKLTNSENNKSYVFEFYKGFSEMGISFDSLNRQFKDPNDFRIETTFCREQDTLYHFQRDTTWTIYFEYTLPEAESRKRFAKFIVHDKIARMIHFNRTATDSEYARIERWMDSKHRFADAVDKDTP
jgi:hypothetical protein